jgi:hypothetical protein
MALQTRNLLRDYAARFGNMDEILLPVFIHDERFLKLLENAIASGVPVDRRQIDEQIPDAPWDY